jgi:hypothetical protein
LEALENSSIFSMGRKTGNLQNRGFLTQNKEIPNIYLEAGGGFGALPPLRGKVAFA